MAEPQKTYPTIPDAMHVGPFAALHAKHLSKFSRRFGLVVLLTGLGVAGVKSAIAMTSLFEWGLTAVAALVLTGVGLYFVRRARLVEHAFSPFDGSDRPLLWSTVFSAIGVVANMVFAGFIANSFAGFIPWRFGSALVIELAIFSTLIFAWPRLAGTVLLRDAFRDNAWEPRTSDNFTRKSLVISFATTIAIVAAAHFWLKPKAPSTGLEVGALSLQTLENGSVPIDSSRPTVLYAWAPWCGACKFQIPQMNALVSRPDDRYDVVSVVFDAKSVDEVETYIAERGLKYPVLMGTNALNATLRVSAYPTVLILKDGVIVWSRAGVTSAREMEKAALSF